jgi:hypothetical protein
VCGRKATILSFLLGFDYCFIRLSVLNIVKLLRWQSFDLFPNLSAILQRSILVAAGHICTDTSEPVDAWQSGAQNMVTVQSAGFARTSDLSITGPTRLSTALSRPGPLRERRREISDCLPSTTGKVKLHVLDINLAVAEIIALLMCVCASVCVCVCV